MITQLPRTPHSLGLAVRFLADKKPFAGYEFGPTINTLLYQLDRQTHLVEVQDEFIVGYLGWIKTTDEIAEGWLASDERLVPVEGGEAAAVTVLAVNDPRQSLGLIRAAKRLEADASVYWKRYYPDARPPSHRSVTKKRPALT